MDILHNIYYFHESDIFTKLWVYSQVRFDVDEEKQPLNPAGEKSSIHDVLKKKYDHTISNLGTLIHLLKGNIGTGILAMADAFKNSGWVIGLLGVTLIGVISTHCMHIIVKCSHELSTRTKKESLSYAEVAEMAFSHKKMAKIAKTVVNTFLCISQLGFCSVYFIFVAENLRAFLLYFCVDLNVYWYMLILLVPLIFINWIKSLKCLTPASLIASALTILGLIIIFSYIFHKLPPISKIKPFGPWQSIPLLFGTAIYAYEAIGVVLPLENNMKTREKFGGHFGILNISMLIVTILYLSIGFFGYLKYGDKAVLGSITLLLPLQFLARSVDAMMAIAIFLTYPLQFYVCINIIWPLVKTEKHPKIAELSLRTFLVLVTFGFAAAAPNLGAVISLVGSVCSTALALVFPPLLQIVIFWPDKLGFLKWVMIKDIVIILFGLAGFATGTYASFFDIIYGQSSTCN